MPQPRDRSKTASPDRRETLSAEERKALAAFDLIDSALDDFAPPEPESSPPAAPELQSRREIKAAKAAAQSAAKIATHNAARQPALSVAPAARAGAHYFASAPPLKEGQGKGVRVQVAGADLVLRAGAGTFSKSEFDAGTKLLLKTFAASPAFSASASPLWCDLGCGWGAVACVLASQKKEARVLACDINLRAASLAQRNARDLELANVTAWNGDGLHACRADCLDAVLCNPPVRAGNAIIGGLFQEALRCLKPGGELWIVLRTSQGAKSWVKRLETLFGNCDTMQISQGYRILRSQKSA